MISIEDKFIKLGIDSAPGQELIENEHSLGNEQFSVSGELVDFSHGDVDAFEPIPTSFDLFKNGFNVGGKQAYTKYRGKESQRENVAKRLSQLYDFDIDFEKNLIVTPGTQGALFLAVGSLVTAGDKMAIVEPDYFANRKLGEFFDCEIFNIPLDYMGCQAKAGIDLQKLENAFKQGVKLFLFSNPNNPTGVIYSESEIVEIAALAQKYNVSVVVDELYSRQIFDNNVFCHLAGEKHRPENVITVIGPSKTESLSGFRLGVAFGTQKIIERMEKLQAIVSLRAAGYNQAVLDAWLNEPENWMSERIHAHQLIRDDIVNVFSKVDGTIIKKTQAGSYLFVGYPKLKIAPKDFVALLQKQAAVIITPGTEFGKNYENYFRINFSQDHNNAVKAVERICTMIEKYRA